MVRRIYLAIKNYIPEIDEAITSIIGKERAKRIFKREGFRGIELGPIEVNDEEARGFDSLPQILGINVTDIKEEEEEEERYRNYFGHSLDVLKPRDYS